MNSFLSDMVIKNIQYFISIPLNRNDTKQIVNRTSMGLIFVSSGKLYYDINGKRYVSDPEHALILPQYGTYHITCVEKSESLLINFLTDPPLEIGDIISFNLGSHHGYIKYFRELDKLWTFKKPSYKLRCMAGLYDMLGRLNETKTSSYIPNYKYELIKPCIEYLEAHYNDPDLSNEQLAGKSNISTVYFRKIFTEKYGVPPMKYVRTKRIEKAQDMLRGRHSSITDIAMATGYKSFSHFSRAFKKVTGYTPSEYMQLY